MTQPEFDLDCPHGWQTRDGRDVVIYCTDASGPIPIHGCIDGIWQSRSWDEDGKIKYPNDDHNFDLINRPAPVVCVPMDKLHDAVFSHTTHDGYILLESSEIIIEGDHQDRSIKWFFVDEVENVK